MPVNGIFAKREKGENRSSRNKTKKEQKKTDSLENRHHAILSEVKLTSQNRLLITRIEPRPSNANDKSAEPIVATAS